jgi:hypothetical protein
MSHPIRTIALAYLTFTSAQTSGAQPPPVRRGFTIPLIDLADQGHRQIIVDREEGQYLGHPTTVLLEDGRTIIIVYPKGHGRGAIVMKRSTDGGLSWSDRLPVPENWSTSRETPTIHRVIDPQGEKRLILFSGLYPIRKSVSEDDGRTWTPLEPIGDFGGIVAMASVERLRDGDYLTLFHDDGRFLRAGGRPTRFRVYRTISHDGGLTWGRPEVIAEHPTAHLCEPGLIRSPDGRQIAVLLRENSRKLNSFVIFSDDEGRTWTAPRELPGSLTGDRHVGKYGPAGRLFVSFRDTTHESPSKGDWVGWVGTYDDIVAGREGQYRVRLMDNHKAADCAYPAVEVLADGTFVATTYGHWTEGEEPYIVSVRFKLAELDELAKVRSRGSPETTRAPSPAGVTITAADDDHLRRALAEAVPGTTIRIASGTYRGGLFARGLRGEPGKPIVLAAANPGRPPVIEGGNYGLHLSDPAYVELHGLVIAKIRGNGLNIDDGGSYDSPAQHILLKGLVIRDIGPDGNRDGIKLSGVDDFRVEDCTVERWGSGGSGIDMVGCHRGTITGCTFRHKGEIGGNGVQAKGGSSRILITGCRFEHAGSRAINLGGSTGLAFFRPRPQGYEAKDLTVEDCTFIGSQAPVAFVGVDGADVRHNTIYRPRRYALRILQETTGTGFVPSRNGRFTDNLIAFRSGEMTLPVNIGPGTAPETFVLARNAWYCLDAPERSRPGLSISEADGVYGVDPRFQDGERGDLRHRTDGPAGRVGARTKDIGPKGRQP